MSVRSDYTLIELGALATIKSQRIRSDEAVTGEDIRSHLSNYHSGQIHSEDVHPCLNKLASDGLIHTTESGTAKVHELTQMGDDVLTHWVSCLVRASRADVGSANEIIAGVDPTDSFDLSLLDVSRLPSIMLAAGCCQARQDPEGIVTTDDLEDPVDTHFGAEVDEDQFTDALYDLERWDCLDFVKSGEYRVTEQGRGVIDFLAGVFVCATDFGADDMVPHALAEPLTVDATGEPESHLATVPETGGESDE